MTESTGTTFESASSAEDVALTQGAAEADAPAVQVAQAAVEVPMPQPGETVRIPVAAGQTIRFAFDVAEAQPSQADGDLVLEINGGTVVLEGFGTAASGEILLEITNADGTVINMADFLVALGISPEAEVLPAAGGEPAGALPGTVPNGGAGFAPGQAPTILASLDPTGPVDPSALLYRVPEREPRLFELDEEPDPAGGEIESSFTTTIDGGEGGYGYDHPSAVIGEFAGGFEDWAPNQHLGDGSPSPMKLNLGLVPTDNEELVSVTISNIPAGVTIFAPGQMVLGNGGNGITIQAADLDDVYVLPAGQTDGDLVLELSAEIRDPDSGIVSEITGTVTGIVDAAADKPEGVGADAPAEVGLGTEVTFEVEAQFGDWTDGSEAQFLLVELPAGWGNPNGYATEIFAAGNPWGIPEGVYVRVPATVDGGTGIGTAQLTLQAPVSLPQGTGAETFHFGVVGKSVETPGDGELTAANDVSYTPIGESSQLPEIPVTVVKPTISIDDVTVDEDAGTATFTVTLHGAVGVSVALGYATGDGSAADGAGESGAGIPDYAATSGNLTFPPSDAATQTLTITVPITDDQVFENPESFLVDLLGVDGTVVDIPGSDLQGVGTIIDNDPVPAITISDGQPLPQEEPDAAGDAPTKIAFTVTLSNSSSQTVTVAYHTVSGTALEGVDFENESGLLTFLPGETTKTIEIEVSGDDIDELLEQFTVELTSPTNASIADGEGVGQIEDTDPTPVLTIDDSSVKEGGKLTFTLSLSNPSSGDIVLDLAAGKPGSATPGADYETASFQYFNGTSWVAAGGPDGTLVTIPAGQTSLKVRIDSHEDWTDEPNETLTLSATPTGDSAAVDASDSGFGTIIDDDPVPTLTILDTVTVEGGPLTFGLVLSNPSSGDIVLDLAAGTPGSATPGVDYETMSFEYYDGSNWMAAGGPNGTQVTIPAGKLGLLVRVDSHEDNIDEAHETLTLSATPAAGSAPVDASDAGTGLILDDDAKPVLTIGDASATEGEGLIFTLSLSNPSAGDIVLNLAAGNPGSATGGIDYETLTFEYFDGTNWVAAGGPNGTQVTIGAGQTSLQVRVDSLEDGIHELSETFTLSAAKAAGSADVATGDKGTGTILDDDPQPTISISDGQPVSQAEPDAASDAPTRISFTVTLSNPSSQAVTVAYQTVGGTALEGIDFESKSGLITFAPGEITKTIEVDVYGDDIDELLEQFTVELSAPVNATILDGQGIGKIADVDAAPVLTIGNASASEGDGLVFTLSLSNPSAGDIVLDLAAGMPGSATPDVDYATTAFEYFDGANWVAAGGPDGTLVTIPAGQTQLQVRVGTIEDSTNEPDETLTLSATPAAGSADVDTSDTGTGTILDDEPAPEVSISDAQASEGDPLVFTVSLSGPTSEDVVLALQAGTPGSAAPGTDYETTTFRYSIDGGATWIDAANGNEVTIPAGTTAILVEVETTEDGTVESDETMTLSVGSVASGALSGWSDTGTGMIVDDDVSFQVTVTSEGAANDLPTQSATIGEESSSDDQGQFQIAMNGFPLSGAGQASVTVTIGGDAAAGAGGDFTQAVAAAIQAGAAAAGVGFVDNGNGTVTLTWSAASTAATVLVDLTAVDDDLAETLESLTLSLGTPAATGGTASVVAGQDSAELQITDADNAITFSIAADKEAISEEGAEAATFTLSLGGFPLAAGNTASVEVSAGGSAGAADYGPALLAALQNAVAGLPGVNLIGSTLTFTSAYDGSPISFTVSATDDSLVEGVETIVASLANPSIGAGTAAILVPSDTVNITEIDNAVTFAIAVSSEDASNDAGSQSATVNEETAADNLGTFQIAMSGGPLTGSNQASVTVTIGGDAESGAGGDFTQAVAAAIQAGAAAANVGFVDNGNGTVTLTWSSASTAQTVEIDLTAFDDDHPDSPETLSLSLGAPAITNGSAAIGGGQDSATLTVTDDDEYVPDAVSEEVSVVEGSLIDYNLMLVIDKSGSMDDDDLLPGPGFLSRLQLAIDALKNMLEAYDSAAGDIQVQIVTFDSTAQGVFPTPGTFYTVAQAIQKLNQIAANGAGGNTDYDDATELAAGAFPNWPDASATQKNIVYFLSDGDPNPNSDALNDSEQAAWQDALDEKGIEVIAVGVGDGITDTTELGKVAYPADNVILVENDTELGAALLGTLPNILSGNVLDNGDAHGGDGWGAPKIVSVEHDGVVYTTASAGYDAASQTLTITTDLGGKLSISFATGQYTYQAPNVNHATTPDPVEEFTYTIQDANGDTDSATLTIRVEDGEPVAYDNYAEVTEGRLVEQTTLVEGFEKDSGWKRVGDAWRSDDHDTQGNRSAAMSTSSWYGAKSIWSLESDLGLPAGTIKNLLGNGEPNNPVEGSGVAKSFVVNTTENSVDIAFDWHFDASSSGYNDAAVYFIKVDGVVVKSAVLQRKSDGDDSGTEEVTLSVTPGSHTVEVIWAAVDVRDDYDNSTLYVDNLTMTDMVPTTDNVVTGNVIADANDDPLSGDPVGGRDVMGSDGATLTRIDYVDAGGNSAFALVPASGASVTVETQNGFLTVDKSGSYSYAAKVNAVTSGAVEQDEFTYTLTDGDGDTDTAKLTIDIHDSVLPPPAEPASILSGTIVTNTNVAHQPLRLTLTQLGNPLNSFSTVLMLDSQGQQSSALDFAVDVGFAIDNSQQYLVTLTSLNGEKVNVTDFVLEGVTIKDQSGNIQLGFPNTGDGLTQVIQPNAPGTAGIPGDDKDVVYSDDSAPFAAGPTTAQAQAGASVPYIQGTGGDDTLTGSDGIDVIAGGAGDDTIYGGGEMDLLFGDAGDDLLFGGAGDDVIHGGAGNDVIVGGQGADRIDVSAGSDTVVYQSVLDGGDLITGFSASGAGRDFVDLDTLFDTLNGGIEAESRAGRVQLVQNGDDVTVNIDVSAGTGPGDGSNYVTLATIQGVSVSDLSVGTGPADDIQTGVG